jgi:2-polyprenyl-3-methyl-5-hydroxy-6-metoxy-1,4-benzoquinol methylase
MTRKKAPLGTTPPRAPTLRATSVGYAGSRSLAARRDVGRTAPLAEPAAGPAVRPPMMAPPRPGEADRDAIETKLFQLVSAHSRVLVIGCDTWPLSRSLSGAGCRVSVVETRHDAPAGSATFSDRVIVGDPDTLNLNATLDGAQFDAIVVVRVLEHVQDPVGMLTALGKHLSADGAIVAAVPNVMHGRIRLGFLAGRSPAGLLSPDPASPSHWYDAATLRRTFESAGFVITTIDRHIEAFAADAPPLNGAPMPAALVEDLTRDADAMTRTFVLVANFFPLSGHVRLEIRVRELTQSHERVTEQMRALEQRAEGLDRRYQELSRACDGTVSKIDRIGADVQSVAAHDSRLLPALATSHQRLTSNRGELEAIRRDLTRFQYELLIPRVRMTVETALPQGAIALVVSKGDERLLAFSGRTGWHFLRNEQGQYAGHHPADSTAAIEALKRLRAEGAGYLVIPQVAMWWLDHYAGLREHLDKHARIVVRSDRTAVIYALARSEGRR